VSMEDGERDPGITNLHTKHTASAHNLRSRFRSSFPQHIRLLQKRIWTGAERLDLKLT
jgi:hypothetical protein